LSLVEELRRAMPPSTKSSAWKRMAAGLVLPLIAGIIKLRSNSPLTIANDSA
jgi:hypothetical protein